jgi:TusA-related sulfurtransferase
MAEHTIDARGLQCPAPIMRLFVIMKTAQTGDLVTITATDKGFTKDVAAWCHKTGHTLDAVDEADGLITARIRKA